MYGSDEGKQEYRAAISEKKVNCKGETYELEVNLCEKKLTSTKNIMLICTKGK